MNGFDNSGGYTASQGGGAGSQQARRDNTVRPVTIKQILGSSEPSPDDGTHIDGHPVGRIYLIGCIRNVTEGSGGFITYKLEDGTGNLEVKWWLDNKKPDNDEDGDQMNDEDDDEDKENAASRFKVGDYVAILGATRVFNGNRSITVQYIKPVTDFNQVIYHQAKALAIHLELTRGHPVTNGGVNNSSVKSDSLFVQGNAGSGLQQRIMDVLRKDSVNSESGVHFATLAKSLGEQADIIKKELDELEQNGLAYQADDDHFMPID